jgi:hypothetical protein
MNYRDERILNGLKTLYLKEYNEEILFSSIVTAKERKSRIMLNPPKNEKVVTLFSMSKKEQIDFQKKNPDLYWKMKKQEESTRKKLQKYQEDSKGVIFEKRLKSFIEYRRETLKRWAKEEKDLLLKPTRDKIEEWEIFENERKKSELNIK